MNAIKIHEMSTAAEQERSVVHGGHLPRCEEPSQGASRCFIFQPCIILCEDKVTQVSPEYSASYWRTFMNNFYLEEPERSFFSS